MQATIIELPIEYKMGEDSVFLCSHKGAFLTQQDSFNPDDGLHMTVVCPLWECTGITEDQATNIYERLA